MIETAAILDCERKAGFLNKLRFPNLWLTIGLLLGMFVVGVSLMPNPSHALYFEGRDKLGHFAAYMAITFWFAQIYTRNQVRWVIALALVILGISLEYLQRSSGFHAFEYADMGANTAGVLCALLLAQTRLSRSLVVVERSLLRCIGQEKPGTMIYRPMG